MNFYKAICDLYSKDLAKVENALSKSIFLKDLEEYPESLYCTGFKFYHGMGCEIDVFFDPIGKTLIHQCSFSQVIPRYMGLIIWHQNKLDQHYYSPLLYDKVKKGHISSFNYKYHLDTNSFISSVSLLHTIKVINKDLGPEHYMEAASTSEIMSIVKSKSDTFSFIFELGNMSSIISYPFRRFYTSYNNTLERFYKKCLHPKKNQTSSWKKLGEDELERWDELHPGWSGGIFD
jgi:hypothetical protein